MIELGNPSVTEKKLGRNYEKMPDTVKLQLERLSKKLIYGSCIENFTIVLGIRRVTSKLLNFIDQEMIDEVVNNSILPQRVTSGEMSIVNHLN